MCHQKTDIKYSPDKMWYIACLIRGMPIDEAIRQMRFVAKKGATYILETLLEAQEKAVKEHNVEFKSNLWVGKCIYMYIVDQWNISQKWLFNPIFFLVLTSWIVCWQRFRDQRHPSACQNANGSGSLQILSLFRASGRRYTTKRLLQDNCYARRATQQLVGTKTKAKDL